MYSLFIDLTHRESPCAAQCRCTSSSVSTSCPLDPPSVPSGDGPARPARQPKNGKTSSGSRLRV
eukprot:4640075-Pyramimonas_sp.AAC.1